MYSEVEFSSRNAEGSPIAFKATIAAVDFMASGSALANIRSHNYRQSGGNDAGLKNTISIKLSQPMLA